MVAAKLANMPRGGDTVSDQSANLRNAKTTQTQAAQLLNVSERTVNSNQARFIWGHFMGRVKSLQVKNSRPPGKPCFV